MFGLTGTNLPPTIRSDRGSHAFIELDVLVLCPLTNGWSSEAMLNEVTLTLPPIQLIGMTQSSG